MQFNNNQKQGLLRASDGIQPHGALLVVNTDNAIVTSVSENCCAILGLDIDHVLGQQLSTVGDEDLYNKTQAALTCFRSAANEQACYFEWQSKKQNRQFSCFVHEQNACIILELEPAFDDTAASTPDPACLLNALKRVQDETDLPAKATAAATLLRDVTGYDRILIYRFDADCKSRLIAEAFAADLEPLPDSHESVTDPIADSLDCGSRMVFDSQAPQNAIITKELDSPTLDLSSCVLHSASDMYRKRLDALGVRASMESPLLCNGFTWGLVLCLHRAPKPSLHSTRELLQWFSIDLARQFHELEKRADDEDAPLTFNTGHELNLLRHCVSQLREGVMLVNENGAVVRINDSAVRMLGLTLEQWNRPEAGISVAALNTGNSDPLTDQVHPITLGLKHIAQQQNQEYQILLPDQEPKWVRLITKMFPTANDSDSRLVSICIREITTELALERKLSQLTKTDPLTGLFNRAHFHEQLSHALVRAQSTNQMIGVLLLDLDHFKYINDSMSHGIGDHLLRHVANRLVGAVRKDDMVARLGGDEFAIFTTPTHARNLIITFAERLSSELKVPFHVNGEELTTSASIGLALFPLDGLTAEDLLKQADIAMYAAKRKTSGTVHVYTEELGSSLQNHIVELNRLKKALELEQFELHYQPKVNVMDGKITGLEALIRWRDSENHLTMPDSFIPLAESSGLIEPIGDWVLQKAVEDLAFLDKVGLGHLSIAVNLSGRQFQNPELVNDIQALLTEHQIAPSRFEIEVTETLLMEDNALTMQHLDQLSTIGVAVCIDDFGTGYSSLAYLRRFKVGTLKIDRSFITNIIDDYDQLKITDAIIKMAKSLDLVTVAEGVEGQIDLDVLKTLKCDSYQGYFYCRPAPLHDLLRGCLKQPKRYPLSLVGTPSNQPQKK